MARDYVIHTEPEIAGIRRAADLTSQVLDRLRQAVRPGVTTGEIDRLAGEIIAENGARSAFLGVSGAGRAPDFPGQICISLNDEVVHGIGRFDRVIQDADLVSIDCGVVRDGFFGDQALTVCVGAPTAQASRLLATTAAALEAGIAAAVPGNTTRDIGAAIQEIIHQEGFSVVRRFVGHAVGLTLHAPPEVPNYPSRSARTRLRPGMVLALEPMVNVGTHRVRTAADRWTVQTADGSWSAHFEHMVLITRGEPEILTWRRGDF